MTDILQLDSATGLLKAVTGASTGPATPGAPVLVGVTGALDPTLNPGGVDPTYTCKSGQAIQAGTLVYVQAVGGIAEAFPALATAFSTLAPYFAVTTVSGSGMDLAVQHTGQCPVPNDGTYTNNDVGLSVYLSDTIPGAFTKTPPTAVGHVVQRVGVIFQVTLTTVTILFTGSADHGYTVGSQGGTDPTVLAHLTDYTNPHHTTAAQAGAVALTAVGAALGVASLDASGKVPSAQLPASVIGALAYQGTWNASTNTPSITTGSANAGNKGFYYKVNGPGSTVVDGNGPWVNGDWIVSDGTVWDKVDNNEAVTSVNGQLGAVVITAASLNAAPTSRLVSTGTGLTGGGDLSADRTIALANTAVTAGTYGDASHVATFTVDAQGRITSASSVAITGGGAVSSVNTRTGAVTLTGADIPVFMASGPSHAVGVVPDPGATPGTTRFLREDATWAVPPGGGSVTLKTNGTTNGSQTILNLVAGVGVTLTDDGLGDVTIGASGGGSAGLALQPGGKALYSEVNPLIPPSVPSTLDDEFSGTALSGAWTQVNWSGLTSYDVGISRQGTLTTANPSTSEVLRAVLKAIPAGDFTIFTRMTFGGPGANFCVAGILLSTNSTATGSANIIGLGFSSGLQRATWTSSGWTSFTQNNESIAVLSTFLRVRRSGSTYYAGWSQDGCTWYEKTVTLNGTPAYFGLCTDNNNTGQVLTVSFDFFRYVASATASLGQAQTIYQAPATATQIQAGIPLYTTTNPDIPPTTASALDDEFESGALNTTTKWTIVQPSAITAYDVGQTKAGALTLSITNQPSSVIRAALLQALPAGDFSVWTKVAGFFPNGSSSGGGLILSTTNTNGTGSQVSLYPVNTGTPNFQVACTTCVNFASGGSNLILENAPQLADRPVYVRYRRSGSTYYAGWSVDGVAWDERTISPGFTPVYVGLYGIDYQASNSQNAIITYDFFRYSSNAVATLGGVQTVYTALPVAVPMSTGLPILSEPNANIPPALPNALDDEFSLNALSGAWTQVNWAPTSYGVGNPLPGALSVTNTGSGSHTIRAILQSLPGGDFTIAAKMSMLWGQGSNPLAGLILSSTNTAGGGTQYVLGSSFTSNTGSRTLQTFTNFNTYGSTQAQVADGFAKGYVRFRRVGSTYYAGWSLDGFTFTEITFVPGVAPGYFGLAVDDNSSGGVSTANFEFIRFAGNGAQVLGGIQTSYQPTGAQAVSGAQAQYLYSDFDPNAPFVPASAYDDEFNSGQGALNSSWTTVNWSNFSTADAGGLYPTKLYLAAATTSSTLSAMLKPLPAGDFTIFTRINSMTKVNYNLLGLCLSDSATAGAGNQTLYGPLQNSAVIRSENWTNFATQGAFANTDSFTSGQYIYLKIMRSGTTYTKSSSLDGLVWSTPTTLTVTGTPAYMGICGYISTTNVAFLVDFFRYAPTATATLGSVRAFSQVSSSIVPVLSPNRTYSLPPAPPPQNSGYVACCLMDDANAFVAGSNGAGPANAHAYTYNRYTDTWTLLPALPYPGQLGAGACKGPDGRIYIFLASTTGVQIYDPKGNTMSTGAALPYAYANGGAANLLTTGPNAGKILLFSDEANARLYDPVANSFSVLGTNPYPISEPKGINLLDGRILYAGGTSSAQTVIYDPVANSYTLKSALPTNVVAHTLALVPNGDVLTLGGSPNTNRVYRYSVATDAWVSYGDILKSVYQRSMGVQFPDYSVLLTMAASGSPAGEFFNPMPLGTTNTTPGTAPWLLGSGPLSPPNPTLFTWVNQGTATVASQIGQTSLSLPTGSGRNFRYLYQGYSGSKRVVLGFNPLILKSTSQDTRLGLVVGDGSGKFIDFSVIQYSGYATTAVEIGEWASPTSIGTGLGSWSSSSLQFPLFLSILDDGTNLKFQVSNDGGQNWDTLFTQARSAFLTSGPSLFGFGGDVNDGTLTVARLNAVHWWVG